MITRNYCIQCTDKTSGKTGCFFYTSSGADLIAVSPVFHDLAAFYEWAKAEGWQEIKGGVNQLVMSRELDTVLSAIQTGLIACLLWAETDDAGDPLDDTYSLEDLAPETLTALQHAIVLFEQNNRKDIAKFMRVTNCDFSSIGHDLWLTSQGHGAGFWDRGAGDVGDRLTEAAKRCGLGSVYVGDDNKIYMMGATA